MENEERQMSETIEIEVTVDGTRVRSISAESVPVPFGRGAPIGATADGTLYAAFATEGPGLESVRLASSDGGRSWSTKRLDWWQFFDHSLDPESSRARFFKNRQSMRSDAFGVLRDGTLLWAFEENPTAPVVDEPTRECYVIRSEDRGDTWDGPVTIDRQGFPTAGNNSNRMTELPDGTVLWPVRLGLTSAEIAKARPGPSLEASSVVGSHVFRSTDLGRTWGDTTPLPDWCWENTLLRLSSGRLVAALRYQPLADVDTQWSKHRKTVFFADSQDNGRTWQDFRPLRRTADGPSELVNGECHGELSELSSGTLVVTYDHRYPYERQQVLARVSHDQGQTWSAEVYNLTRAGGSILGSSTRGYGSGYTSSVVLEDDTIVTMTGAGNCLRWRVG